MEPREETGKGDGAELDGKGVGDAGSEEGEVGICKM